MERRIEEVIDDLTALRERLRDQFDGQSLDMMVLAAAIILANKDVLNAGKSYGPPY